MAEAQLPPVIVPSPTEAIERAVRHAEEARSGPGGVEHQLVIATLALAWSNIALAKIQQEAVAKTDSKRGGAEGG